MDITAKPVMPASWWQSRSWWEATRTVPWRLWTTLWVNTSQVCVSR